MRRKSRRHSLAKERKALRKSNPELHKLLKSLDLETRNMDLSDTSRIRLPYVDAQPIHEAEWENS